MARDKDEALQRLQQALLEEEETDIDESLDEEFPDFFTDDDPQIADAEAYQNYSNDYGKNLRNYASGYRAYNADKTDTDLDRYSDEVQNGQPSRRLLWLPVILLVLLAVVVFAMLWKYLGWGGIL